jgi:hypothetical protein
MADGTIMEVEGMSLQIGDAASPETFSTILGIKEIPRIKKSKTRRDRTEVQSTQQSVYPGQEQAAEITMTVFYYGGNTNHELLQTLWTSEATRNFKIVGSDSPASEWPFTARVFDMSTPGGGIDTDATFELTLICTTNPTLT